MNVEREAKRTVLIVDDDEEVRSLLREALQREGHETAVAEDGQEAVEAAVRLRPDLIIMDLRMPVLNGIAAARRIRELLPSALILIISGLDQGIFREEALSVGCAAFLSKPFDLTELTQVVRSLLG